MSAAEDLERELGLAKTTPQSANTVTLDTPFARANAVPAADVAAWLGLLDGEHLRCPGCGESGDTSVAFTPQANGAKCLHDRCADRAKAGFRTPVDLVVEAKGVSPREAVELMAERFGFEGFAKPKDQKPEASSEPSEPKKGSTFADVFARWRSEGPLIHEPTGIATLDELTGGGLVYGTRIYLPGAPDAGKTAFQVQIAHHYAERGVWVALLAVDEEDSDLVTRFAQRVGWSRKHCEVRDHGVLAEMAKKFSSLPVRFYDHRWTIEDAAADIARQAKGGRAALFVDSLQNVTCNAEALALASGRELSTREAVTGRVQAIRDVATRHRLITSSTSEMNRASFRTKEAAEQSTDMASAAESRAVEYSGRLVLAIRSVADETDLVEVRVVKNKLGPAGARIYLRLDRASQVLSECSYEAPSPENRQQARADRSRQRVATDAGIVAGILRERPGLGVRELKSAAKVKAGMGKDRVDAAVEYLGSAITTTIGAKSKREMSLDHAALPDDVRA